MLLVVLVAALVDRVTGERALLRSAAAWFYVGNEAISLLENLSRAGVPVPGALRRALEGFREQPKQASQQKQAPDAPEPA